MFTPSVFDQDDSDGLVRLLDPDPPDDVHAWVREGGSRVPLGRDRGHRAVVIDERSSRSR